MERRDSPFRGLRPRRGQPGAILGRPHGMHRRIPGAQLTRRDVLRAFGLGAAALSTSGLAAACGASTTSNQASPSFVARTDDDGSGADLRILNWPNYIDSTVIEAFGAKTGLSVHYREDIQSNVDVMTRIRAAQTSGRPLADIVIANAAVAARLGAEGLLETFPITLAPNSDRLLPTFRSSGDMAVHFSIPWATYYTGLMYDVSLTGRDLVSVEDLFDPDFRGATSVLADVRETMGLLRLSANQPLSTLSAATTKPQLDALRAAVSSGQTRVLGADYAAEFREGKLVACLAWSGDAGQIVADNKNVRFVYPRRGALESTDVVMIPKGGNVEAAAKFANFHLDMARAATFCLETAYPVPLLSLVDEVALRGAEGKALAENPIVFPTYVTRRRIHATPVLAAALEDELVAAFTAATG